MGKLEQCQYVQEGLETDKEKSAESISDNSDQKSGQTYGLTDQELIRQLAKSRMAQKQPLEYEDLDGYEMPPRSQFSMLRKPAVSIKYGKLTFNMASIRLFEGVQYVLPLCHPKKKRLTIVMCHEEESASVEWARVRKKDGAWVNKSITSLEYVDKIYKMMGWNKECRYKVLGHVSNSKEGLVLVFELDEAVMYESRQMTYVDETTGETRKKKRNVAYYPELYKDRVGKSYNDYVAARQINMFEYLEEYVGNTYSDYTGVENVVGQGTNHPLENTPELFVEADGNPRTNSDRVSAAGSATEKGVGQILAEKDLPKPKLYDQSVLDMGILTAMDNNDIKAQNDVWRQDGW